MEENYGKKQAVLKIQGMILLPVVMAVLLLAVVFASVLITGLRNGSVNIPVVVISGILAVGALFILIKQIFTVNLVIYENTLVQNNLFNKKVIPADTISAMIWTFPGENPLNSRAARINNTSAEIVFKDGSKAVKVQDSYYRDFVKELSAFQKNNNIPADLEKKNKSRKYD
jgi:hypothetical protein